MFFLSPCPRAFSCSFSSFIACTHWRNISCSHRMHTLPSSSSRSLPQCSQNASKTTCANSFTSLRRTPATMCACQFPWVTPCGRNLFYWAVSTLWAFCWIVILALTFTVPPNQISAVLAVLSLVVPAPQLVAYDSRHVHIPPASSLFTFQGANSSLFLSGLPNKTKQLIK